jgi:hypothetical protein
MAQTRRKRRRKHRGTQGGRIDTRPARGRARSRAEAQARARNRSKSKKSGPRVPDPPSWSSAIKKGALGAAIFAAALAIFGTNPAGVLLIGLLAIGFYTPFAYMLDGFVYRRHLRKEAAKRAEKEKQRAGHQQAPG